jgi:hypothetical protein
MSEAEATEVEVPEVEKTQMEINLDNFVDAIQATNYNQAGDLFNDMLGSKLQDAMDAEKVAVAADIFNNNDEDIDIEDLELDLEDDIEESEEVEVEEEPEEDLGES